MAETLTVTIDGGTYAVSVTGVSLFSDSALTTSVTFPQSVSADTTWYAAPAARGGRRQILVRATAPNGDNIQVDVLQSLPATVDLGEGAVDYSGPSSPGGSIPVSFLSVDGGSWSGSGKINFHAGTVQEDVGSILTLETDGSITVAEECLLSITVQTGVTGDSGTGTATSLLLTDTDTPTWGPVGNAPAPRTVFTMSATYRFPAGDSVWAELTSDVTSRVLGFTRLWVTAIPVTAPAF